mgnify:CR=1 FL=1
MLLFLAHATLGVASTQAPAVPRVGAPMPPRPSWLHVPAPGGARTRYEDLRNSVHGLNLHTVCEEAQCPNIGECWNGGTGTIMVLGDTCTRGCTFCAVNTASTPLPPDESEPMNVAQSIAQWGVDYVVVTSVDRDDLPDGGAGHFRRTVQMMKVLKPQLLVECLVSDFRGTSDAPRPNGQIRRGACAALRARRYPGALQATAAAVRACLQPCPLSGRPELDRDKSGASRMPLFVRRAPGTAGDLTAVEALATSGLDVYAHNVETVERLQPHVRDRRASYRQSLAVLRHAKVAQPGLVTKSSLMLGLGETSSEVRRTMDEMREAQIDILTLGQYLRPTERHLSVVEYVHPAQFDEYRDYGLSIGFDFVAAGPLVRSSYRAGELYLENKLKRAQTQRGASPLP